MVDMSTNSSWTPAGRDNDHRAFTLLVWSPGGLGTPVTNQGSSCLDTGFESVLSPHFSLTSTCIVKR